jgi:aminopeptidase N
LTVSPIPGAFGQGFPGLVYLSTLSYLDPKERPAQVRSDYQRIFFSEILHAHETAHQWWGSIVTASGYRDAWLMEALANYTALLFLEKKAGARALYAVLEDYREHLLAKKEDGATIESTGPIVWGTRLSSSQSPGAWRTITYEKGSWILHLLRAQLGDAAFSRMLGELRRRFEFKSVSTENFRQLASEFVPSSAPDRSLESFFDAWVYGTGVPSLKLSYSVRGKAPRYAVSGAVAQGGVAEEFSIWVPLEIHYGRGRPQVHWVRTGAGSTPFNFTLKQKPLKVVLDANLVLTRN